MKYSLKLTVYKHRKKNEKRTHSNGGKFWTKKNQSLSHSSATY